MQGRIRTRAAEVKSCNSLSLKRCAVRDSIEPRSRVRDSRRSREASMPIEFIGMIGVKPEGADGAAVHVIGGEIDLGWVRDFSQAHEHAGFDKVLVGYTSTS